MTQKNDELAVEKVAAEKVKSEKAAYLASLNLGPSVEKSEKPKVKKISQKGRERAAKVKLMKLKGTAKGPMHVPQARLSAKIFQSDVFSHKVLTYSGNSK